MTTIQWNDVKTFNNITYTSVAYSIKDNTFVAIGYNTDKTVIYISNSVDGINWNDTYSKTYDTPLTNDILGQIFYIEEKQLYIAFVPNENNSNTDCLNSTDGVLWTYESTIVDYTCNLSDQGFTINKQLVYDTKNSVFICTLQTPSESNTINFIFRSNDGKNWQLLNNIVQNYIFILSITYVDGKLLCVIRDEKLSYILTSTDGGNKWSTSLTTTRALTLILSSNQLITCFVYPKSIFTSDTKNISWTEYNINTDYYIYDGLYAGGIYTVLATGIFGENNITKYGTSLDGVNWIFNNLYNTPVLLGLSYSYFIKKYMTFNSVFSSNNTNVLLGTPIPEPICLPSGSPLLPIKE